MAAGMHAEGSFDYVIVGAGSAGCVLADRLTADGRHRALLLEAGGKVLGGSSSINGMIYIRGNAADYDHWRQLGNAGWSYDDVLPYFRKAEDQVRGADEFHGTGGPLAVAEQRDFHPLARAHLAAAVEAGYPLNPDFNGATQEGFGRYQVNMRNGRRWSTARGYLRAARKRPNFAVITGARASRVLFEGRRAVGVEYTVGNETRTVRPRAETILALGSFNSPQLLQLSGVGPAALLRGHGIDVVADMAGVGTGMQDHYLARTVYRCKQPVTLNDVVASRWRSAAMVLRYLVQRRGMMAMAPVPTGGFIRSDPSVASPDIQTHIVPFSNSGGTGRQGAGLDPFSGLSSTAILLRPESRGAVEIASADPRDPPLIRSRYLSTQRDCETLMRGVRAVRSIMRQPALAAYVGDELEPGADITSDAGLIDYLRNFGATGFHPTSTCRMGADDTAVVDARLRVHGLDALRVVDASVMPAIVSGNTNAPTIMIAEKAADMILADGGAGPARAA